MSDDRLTRRRVLRTAAIGGSIGLASGAGTSALFSDGETFGENAARAGSLDLLVLTELGATPCEWAPSLADGGSSNEVALEESSGSVGVATTVCTNPATVTLRLGASGDDDPFVRLRTGDCGAERVLAAGRLSSVIDALAGGLVLNPDCSHLGKLEADDEGASFTPEGGDVVGEDTFAFPHAGDVVTVAVTDRFYKGDGEVEGVSLAVDGGDLCQVNVKGGGKPRDPSAGTAGGKPTGASDASVQCDSNDAPSWGSGVSPYFFSCGGDAADPTALYAPLNPAGRQSAVSAVELYVCDGSPCVVCDPEDPLTVFLEWACATGATTLDLDLTATQCRHRTEANNES